MPACRARPRGPDRRWTPSAAFAWRNGTDAQRSRPGGSHGSRFRREGHDTRRRSPGRQPRRTRCAADTGVRRLRTLRASRSSRTPSPRRSGGRRQRAFVSAGFPHRPLRPALLAEPALNPEDDALHVARRAATGASACRGARSRSAAPSGATRARFRPRYLRSGGRAANGFARPLWRPWMGVT